MVKIFLEHSYFTFSVKLLVFFKNHWKSLSHVRLFATPSTVLSMESPRPELKWLAFPFSRGSSQPRDQTQDSHTTGGFFTSWATREALFKKSGTPQKDKKLDTKDKISSVQLFSCVQLFQIPWTAALQASLSITKPGSLLKLMSIELMMPSNHLILFCPLLLLPSIFPSTRVDRKSVV